MDTVWLACHKKLVALSASRKLLIAYGVGHHIAIDNPLLIVNAIVTQYANYLVHKQKIFVIEKAYVNTLEMSNNSKKNEIKCGQTEDDLTTWGYALLEKNEIMKAIEIFKLKVMLYPQGWNTYDSLGEVYLKSGNKELAIKNYKKSLELNPKNDNATNILKQIEK